MRVLGIDPGLRNTGFGVIENVEGKLFYIQSGVICTKSDEVFALRLKSIFDGITEIINITKPDVVSIGKVFVNINPQSTLLLGQARGTAIVACGLHELPIMEYTALQVKKTIVGYGHAKKHQVLHMVKTILQLNKNPQIDAADALAVAITHMNFTTKCYFN